MCALCLFPTRRTHSLVQHQVGTFHEGKEFDALIVDVNVPGGPFDVFDGTLHSATECV